MSPAVRLRHVDLPDFGASADQPAIPDAEFAARADALHAAAGTDWVAVYGDREHSANLIHLTGFDPRFEEAVLLLGPGGARRLLLGNEGVIHAVESRLPADHVLAQSLGLMGQPRDAAPRIADALREAGLSRGDSVGVVGWKYREATESSAPGRPAFVAAFLVDDLRAVTGQEPVDVTHLLMHPTDGQRARLSAAQIAAFEWAAARTGAAVMRVIRGTRPGMTERDAIANMGYAGEHMAIHPNLVSASAGEVFNGLRSASGRTIREGDAITCGIGYWGALTCRAGLVRAEPDGAFTDRAVAPYFAAQAAWYAALGVGVRGSDVFDSVIGALEAAGADFRPLLNPGHLIGHDEWVHSPIAAGSDQRLGSGMALQCDIIPNRLPSGWALNCEDGIALADASLRAELARDYPELWSRIEARRAFMTGSLGLTLSPDVLPLTGTNAYLPPYWLDPSLVCTLA